MATVMGISRNSNQLGSGSRSSDAAYEQTRIDLHEQMLSSLDMIYPGFRDRVCAPDAPQTIFNREITH